MSSKVTLYKSIALFLKHEIEGGSYTAEISESLEVAKQCLESAFGFSADDRQGVPDLFTIFSTNTQASASFHPEPTPEAKAMAETLKNQGNHCMKENQFQEAVACYTKAIELHPSNAVYYCNRAAAYSRMDQQQKAIDDCKSALEIDPTYSKAYGRMGIAYSNLGDHAKAVEAYRKGLELDPTNENCQQNLALAEERLREGTNNGPLSGLNFGMLLENPAIRNIAFQLLRDPNTQNAFINMFQNATGASEAPAGTNTANSAAFTPNASTAPNSTPNDTAPSSTTGSTSSESTNQFLRLGQQLAQQMRSMNPELVDQLRQSFQNIFPPGSAGPTDASH